MQDDAALASHQLECLNDHGPPLKSWKIAFMLSLLKRCSGANTF